MTHWRGLIEREYLGAWDLVDKAGKPKDIPDWLHALADEIDRAEKAVFGKEKS